jgi:hypothetical protein
VNPLGACHSGPTMSRFHTAKGHVMGMVCMRREMSLPSVELAPLAMAHDVLGVHHCCGPVESLSESFPDKCPWTSVMPARVGMDFVE